MKPPGFLFARLGRVFALGFCQFRPGAANPALRSVGDGCSRDAHAPPSQDYVSQRLLPGLHMLLAAPGGSRQLPVQFPVWLLVNPGAAPVSAPSAIPAAWSPVGPISSVAPGAAPAARGLPPRHAPGASLDASGGRQPAGTGGGLGGGRPTDGLHVSAQRGSVAADLPWAGGSRIQP